MGFAERQPLVVDKSAGMQGWKPQDEMLTGKARVYAPQAVCAPAAWWRGSASGCARLKG